MIKRSSKFYIRAICAAALIGLSAQPEMCAAGSAAAALRCGETAGESIAAALAEVQAADLSLRPIMAYAAEGDYRIGAADWDYNDETGCITAVWDEANDKTTYVLDVYRNYISEKNRLYKNTIKTNGASHDFSKTVAKFGTGTYYYTVYPKKGGSSMRITSGSFEVDSDMLTKVREYTDYKATSKTRKYGSSNTAINLETPLGWTMLPDGNWKYRITKTSFAKNQWLKVNGKWYYFGADSIMLKGWQNIGGKYYYFNPDGDLWMGGNKGKQSTGTIQGLPSSVQTAERTATKDNAEHAYSGKTQSVGSFTISFKEDEAEPNRLRPMTVTVPSNAQITDIGYSVPQENWNPGTKVGVTMTVKAVGNYQFGNGMKVYASNGTFKSQAGDAFTRTLRFEYVPKTRLAKPQRVYLDGDSVIKWSKVSGASRYNVRISYDEEYTYNPESGSSDMTIYIDEGDDETRYKGQSRSVTVNEPQIDVSDYIGIDELKDVKFYITAAAASSRSAYYLNSEAVEFTAAQGQVESSTNSGSVTTNKNGDMVFIDSGGSYISGWQDIDGAWYYFENKGAAVTGWKQIDKRWYYFGEDNKMRTGWIELGDYWYYLNDMVGDVYGAMLTGTHNIGGTDYYLNDNASGGVPLGAWVK